MIKKRYIVGGLIIVSLLIISAVGYMNRGTIRQEFIPSLVERKYAPKVNQVFDAKMAPVIEQLKQHELVHSYETKSPTQCSAAVYSWLRETVRCERTAYIKAQPLDESLKVKWREAIPDFYDKNLLINGWLWDGSGTHADAASQLGMLPNEPEVLSSISFSNRQDEATCTMSFTHHRPEAGGETILGIHAGCQRWVKVSGGFPEHLNP